MLDLFFYLLLELVNSSSWSKDIIRSEYYFQLQLAAQHYVRTHARKVEVLGLSSNELEESKKKEQQ